MYRTLTTAALALALGLMPVATTGCANETESERTLRKADRMEDAGLMIKRGEGMEAEGEAMIAQGRTLRDQGNRTQGETMIAEGEAKRTAGRTMISKGKDLRD
ncbi:MAG TPA: hypothetical protein VF624_12130 [Tepidisphaeraceae bacterium]|jgi:hypothetical protein